MSERARDDRQGTAPVVPPMAPSEAEWAQMTPGDRRRVADSLPADLGVLPSEGTPHANTVRHVRNTLDDHFSRSGRAVFIANDLAVYYPKEPVFSPDIMAVVDVGMHDRMRWLVSEEGRGIDLALEILVAGDRRKDLERNVERYARLGIREYFVFDYSRVRLFGYRLGAARRYEPLSPQFGRLHSDVLGLEMQLQGARLRFYVGATLVPEASERIATLEGMLANAEERIRSEAEEREQEVRLREEEARLRAEAEARLAAALAELEKLRGPAK
jgi:Uma2 family endonuclease